MSQCSFICTQLNVFKCDTVLAFRCVGVFVRRSENLFALARNTHKGVEGEIYHQTESGGGKEGPRENRERELTKKGRREQSV